MRIFGPRPENHLKNKQNPHQKSFLKENTIKKSPIKENPIKKSSISKSPINKFPIKKSPLKDNPLQKSPPQINPLKKSAPEENTLKKSPGKKNLIKEIEEIYRLFFNEATDSFALLDKNLNILEVNQSAFKRWGLKKEDVIGKNFMDILPPSRREFWHHKFKEVLKNGKPLSLHNLPLYQSYGERFVNVNLFKLGNTLCFIATETTEQKKAEKSFHETQYRFRQLLDSMSEAVLVLDKDGRITYANKNFMEKSGYSEEEIIGRPPSDFIIPPYVKNFKQQFSNRKQGISTTYEIEVKVKDGRKAFLSVSGAPLFDDKDNFKGSIVVITDITIRRRAEEELKKSRQELRSLYRHLQSVREKESKRIAREIHDELAQTLTALKMDTSWLSHKLPPSQHHQIRLLEKIKSMSHLIDKTIRTVQRISSELRPRILDDLGLIPAIEWHLQDFQKRTAIQCSFDSACNGLELDPERSTAVFRIFQEALTNVARHASATRVKISLIKKDSTLDMKISDNGRGIKERDIFSSKSLGLLGMKERLRPLGGKLKINGTPHKGTTLSISLPMESPRTKELSYE